ncbi:hypothetical protein FOA43_002844 [Brettanomyces nanus]|uniref:Yippee domain-containing protein n=1 Tax=Eeniella nana TaxID=13502 RepID=A0A875S6Z7_EENNA|nr:uncharacterized protein FOA43_002844 [Brettanomyces nanus]QPG75489.1 hypothetical protein FOA43_002844 [Brettanomyces nanus]
MGLTSDDLLDSHRQLYYGSSTKRFPSIGDSSQNATLGTTLLPALNPAQMASVLPVARVAPIAPVAPVAFMTTTTIHSAPITNLLSTPPVSQYRSSISSTSTSTASSSNSFSSSSTLTTTPHSSSPSQLPYFSFFIDAQNKSLLTPPTASNHPALNSFSSSSNISAHILRCKQCHNHICTNKLVISTNFYGNYGPALFVSKVLNIKLGDSEEFKKMRTGKYEVKTIYCKQCDVNLGWKYLYSEQEGEKYKEDKFVIERSLLEEADY